MTMRRLLPPLAVYCQGNKLVGSIALRRIQSVLWQTARFTVTVNLIKISLSTLVFHAEFLYLIAKYRNLTIMQKTWSVYTNKATVAVPAISSSFHRILFAPVCSLTGFATQTVLLLIHRTDNPRPQRECAGRDTLVLSRLQLEFRCLITALSGLGFLICQCPGRISSPLHLNVCVAFLFPLRHLRQI